MDNSNSSAAGALERDIASARFELPRAADRSCPNVAASRTQDCCSRNRANRDVAATGRCHQIARCLLDKNMPAIGDEPGGSADLAGGYVSAAGVYRNTALNAAHLNVSAPGGNIKVVISWHRNIKHHCKMLPPMAMWRACQQQHSIRRVARDKREAVQNSPRAGIV